jgi:SAM-dependent methyltransferase
MLPYNKVCEVEDFTHPDLLPILHEIYPHERSRFGQSWPTGREYRKDWEVAMSIRALRDMGALHPDAEVLGVGAGTESTIFYLTNHVRRVFATDLYLQEWQSESANVGMFLNPDRYWPGLWNPRRLVVQHMNALDLKYEDATFDAIFSSSSIEHFGGHDEIRQAVREMARVLKPGGVLSLATEFRLAGPSPGMDNCLMFDEEELTDLVIGAADWQPANPLVSSCSLLSRSTEQPFSELLAVVQAHVAEFGELLYHKLVWPKYPCVGLTHGPLAWTSVHLAIHKQGS